MDMLTVHENALQSPITAYHGFLEVYKPHTAAVYGFVEGKEIYRIYRGLIDQRLPEDRTVELIIADNKNKVLGLP